MKIAQNTKMQSTDGVKAAAAQDENSSACSNKVENAPHGRPSQQLTLDSSTNFCLHSCRGLGFPAS
jgi:hypothetical protein